MKRINAAVVVALALLAGLSGGVLSSRFSDPQPVHAADRRIKIALLDLVKASRQSATYIKLKINFDEEMKRLKDAMETKKADLEKMNKDLEEKKRRNADAQDIQLKEVDIKGEQEKLKVMQEYYQKWLGDLSNGFQKDVLAEVYEKAKEYCTKNGYDLMIQDYEVDSTASKGDDELSGTRAWAETLKTKPVLFASRSEPDKPTAPNVFVQDITDEIIKLVK